MTSGRSRRNYDKVVAMDVACNVDLVDTSDIADCRFDEPEEVQERVKRPMNDFMVWSQVISAVSETQLLPALY